MERDLAGVKEQKAWATQPSAGEDSLWKLCGLRGAEMGKQNTGEDAYNEEAGKAERLIKRQKTVSKKTCQSGLKSIKCQKVHIEHYCRYFPWLPSFMVS